MSKMHSVGKMSHYFSYYTIWAHPALGNLIQAAKLPILLPFALLVERSLIYKSGTSGNAKSVEGCKKAEEHHRRSSSYFLSKRDFGGYQMKMKYDAAMMHKVMLFYDFY